MRRHLLCALLTIASLTSLAATAQAEEHDLYVAGGAEGWFSPELGGHGYALVSYQRFDMWRGLDLDLTYNTDTLQATARGLRISDNLELGGYLKGQAIFGGLLTDFYQEGLLVPGRGFNASYVQGAALIEANAKPVFMQLELGGRRWAFNANDNTSPDLVLPPDMWVFEPRLRITYWEIEHDRSINEPHRHYWRVEGWGLGLELGSDFRQGWRGWGEVADDAHEGADRRNLSGDQPITFRGWLRWGMQVFEPLRVQTSLFVSAARNEDDLTRVRLGGMNPYVVPLAGLPWASHLPQNFGAAQVSAHFRLYGESEVGLLADAAQLSEADALRVAYSPETDGLGASLYGVGVFGDWRWGDGWQLHVRGGYALPSDFLAESPHLTAWLSVGKQIF